jgi:hypothetical protein
MALRREIILEQTKDYKDKWKRYRVVQMQNLAQWSVMVKDGKKKGLTQFHFRVGGEIQFEEYETLIRLRKELGKEEINVILRVAG